MRSLGYARSVFEWDDGNIRHIRAHNVTREETEQAILDPLCIDTDASSMEDEYREGIVGMTAGGRVGLLLYTDRGSLIRVVQAKTATVRQQRAYLRQRT